MEDWLNREIGDTLKGLGEHLEGCTPDSLYESARTVASARSHAPRWVPRLLYVSVAAIAVLVIILSPAFLGNVLLWANANKGPVYELEQIVDRMANAADHYDAVAVTFISHDYRSPGESAEGRLWVRWRPNPGARAEIAFSDGRQLTLVNDGTKELELNPQANSYRIRKVSVRSNEPWISTFERFTGNSFRYRSAPVSLGTSLASALYPQQEALALVSRSKVTVDRQEQVLGRTTNVLTLVPPENLNDLWDKVVLWVDADLGILWKQEYWRGGNLVMEQHATQIEIDPQLDSTQFQVKVPTGATELPSPG